MALREKMENFNDAKPRYLLEEHKIVENLPSQPTIFEQPWDIDEFRRQCKVVIVHNRVDEMEFDLIRMHPALVNAFRRIILREVPSMAIDKVHVLNNTSIMQDETLVHRLGLVPLKADPRLFRMRTDESTDYTEENSLEFTLKIKCTPNSENSKEGSSLANDMYKNSNVTTKHIKWLPIGKQKERFCEEDVGPIDSDILITKLIPRMELDLKLVAVKSVGMDHAKFQPVCTAYFRLLPELKLVRPVEGEAAERLRRCFSPGTIGVREENGKKVAFIDKKSRYETCSRNVYDHEDLKDAVLISKVRDHHVFTIETVGALRPDEIFIEAVKILKAKCLSALEELSQV